MGPVNYLQEYRKLKVQLVNGITLFGIDVHEYRNAQDVFDSRNTDSDKTNDVDGMPADLDAGPGWNTAWGALRAKIAAHGKLMGKDLYRLRFPLPTKENPKPAVTVEEYVFLSQLAQVYIGKGTPEHCAQALRLAEALGLISPTVAAMQSYCDDYIGLDCNGFVGTYLKKRGCTVVGPDTPAFPYAFIPQQWRLSKLEDVKVESVLCWKDAGHVAIVGQILERIYQIPHKHSSWVLRCGVCEATGARRIANDAHTDGLNHTVYEIHPPGKDNIFKIRRGLGGNNLNDVYIGNLLTGMM
jgi:hypothetical protein